MAEDSKLSPELKDLANMEAAVFTRQAMSRADSMLHAAHLLANEMILLAVEIAREKVKKGIDSGDFESIIKGKHG